MKELQQTLSELEREGREMAAQRLSGSACQTRTGPTANRSAQTDDAVPRDQVWNRLLWVLYLSEQHNNPGRLLKYYWLD